MLHSFFCSTKSVGGKDNDGPWIPVTGTSFLLVSGPGCLDAGPQLPLVCHLSVTENCLQNELEYYFPIALSQKQ